MFITFEGPEGAGKTTQLTLLNKFLQGLGYPTLVTREPGGTALSEDIRCLLLYGPADINPLAEVLLYAAARAQLVAEIIKPALAQNKVVLCDRFVDSSIAYQGYGQGLDLNIVKQINSWATTGLQPDLTILLDVAPAAGLLRKQPQVPLDRIERQAIDYHQRVRQGYLQLAQQEPERIHVISAMPDVSDVYGAVQQIILAHFTGEEGVNSVNVNSD